VKEPRWLRRDAADVIHHRSIERHGGSPGIRDSALIESALSRPVHRWAYDPGCDLFDLAASYAFGFAKNHGYVDGNKRIAFSAMSVSLYVNGWMLDAADDEAVRMMVGLASGEVSESEIGTWLRQRSMAL
jgi:death-on-curing protein